MVLYLSEGSAGRAPPEEIHSVLEIRLPGPDGFRRNWVPRGIAASPPSVDPDLDALAELQGRRLEQDAHLVVQAHPARVELVELGLDALLAPQLPVIFRQVPKTNRATRT